MNKLIYWLKLIRKHIFFSGYGSFGVSSKLIKPLRISNKKFIFVGENVIIRDGIRIEVVRDWFGTPHDGSIHIGNRTTIEQGCHFVAANKLIIGEDCVISANVFISDCNHEFANVDENILFQSLNVKKTIISNQAFLGYNSVIMPGVKIGVHSIVGANSVVTHDVDDYCVVAGNPAKVISRYDYSTGSWRKIY